MGRTCSYLACVTGHLVPVWQPCIGSSFQTPERVSSQDPPLQGARPRCAVLQAAKDLGVAVHSFDEFLDLGRASPADAVPPSPDDYCTIMYTSGTTGDPKVPTRLCTRHLHLAQPAGPQGAVPLATRVASGATGDPQACIGPTGMKARALPESARFHGLGSRWRPSLSDSVVLRYAAGRANQAQRDGGVRCRAEGLPGTDRAQCRRRVADGGRRHAVLPAAGAHLRPVGRLAAGLGASRSAGATQRGQLAGGIGHWVPIWQQRVAGPGAPAACQLPPPPLSLQPQSKRARLSWRRMGAETSTSSEAGHACYLSILVTVYPRGLRGGVRCVTDSGNACAPRQGRRGAVPVPGRQHRLLARRHQGPGR
jgi:hypothetical protein